MSTSEMEVSLAMDRSDTALSLRQSKSSEVRTTPVGWNELSINDLFAFGRTASNSRADLGETGSVAYVHYGEIHTVLHDHFVDFARDRMPYLLSDRNLAATCLRDGDLIVVDASEDEAGVGKGVEVRNLGSTLAVGGLHTVLLRPRDARIEVGYRAYLLEKPQVKSQLRRLATGLKVFGLSKRALLSIHIPLPPRPEQRAIAEALSGVDGLLASLEKLIGKKRAIKQAAMQQLLTGKTRLPGFSGEWEMKRIGGYCGLCRNVGNTKHTQVSAYWKGTIPWCTPTDITVQLKGGMSHRCLKDRSQHHQRGVRDSCAYKNCFRLVLFS